MSQNEETKEYSHPLKLLTFFHIHKIKILKAYIYIYIHIYIYTYIYTYIHIYIYNYRVSYNTTKYLLVPIIIKCTKIKTEDTLTWSQIFGRWSERQYRRVSSLFKKTQKKQARTSQVFGSTMHFKTQGPACACWHYLNHHVSHCHK